MWDSLESKEREREKGGEEEGNNVGNSLTPKMYVTFN